MGVQEREPHVDEFEIEVTDLRSASAGTPSDTATTGHIGDRSSSPGEQSPIELFGQPLQARPARAGLGRALSPRHRRRLQGALVGATLLLAVVFIFSSVPGSTATLADLLHIATPIPTAPLAPGADNIIAARGVPWGTLLVDGHARPDANLHTVYQGVFRLSRGRHTLEYQAAPFPTLRCTISVPLASRDTCPLLDTSRLGGQPNGIPGDTRVVDLRATPDRLSADQLAALTNGVMAALTNGVMAALTDWLPPTSASAVVAPGERYVAADGSIATATRPLKATFLYTLNQDQSRIVGADGCVTFCLLPAVEAPLSGVWMVNVLLQHGWSYADASSDGRVLIPYAPALPSMLVSRSAPFDSFSFDFKGFSARWDGAWHVSANPTGEASNDSYSDPTCILGLNLVSTLNNDANALSELSPIPLPHVADGCLIRELPVNDHDHSAYFLYRFGVLLAVGSGARTAQPKLPVAIPDEFALAQQAAARSGMQIAP